MHTRWGRQGSVALLLVLAAAACERGPGGPAPCAYGAPTAPLAGTFLTWNLYLGAPVQDVILADPAERPAIIEAGFEQVLATDFASRAEVIADAIELADPDLIGLQEVAHWLIQSPGDETGPAPAPATESVADFLAILVQALAHRGLTYVPVAAVTNVDIELPSASGDDVRFLDRNVILARAGVATFTPRSGQFAARFSYNGITIARGWAAIDAVIGAQALRFVTTHLETAELEALLGLQTRQTEELLDLLCDATVPLVVAGDLNSDPL